MDHLFSIAELDDVLVFLRHCDFLGERAARLSEELAAIVEEHLEGVYSFFGNSYPFSSDDCD